MVLVVSAERPTTALLPSDSEMFILDDLGKVMEDFIDEIHKERSGLIKRIWHQSQMGLSQSRITGWKQATGDVVAILDAHVEATRGW